MMRKNSILNTVWNTLIAFVSKKLFDLKAKFDKSKQTVKKFATEQMQLCSAFFPTLDQNRLNTAIVSGLKEEVDLQMSNYVSSPKKEFQTFAECWITGTQWRVQTMKITKTIFSVLMMKMETRTPVEMMVQVKTAVMVDIRMKAKKIKMNIVH